MRRPTFASLLLIVLAVSGCDGSVLAEHPADAVRAPTAVDTPLPSASETPSATKPPRPRKTRPLATSLPTPTPTITVPDFTLPPTPTGPILGGDISWPQCPKGLGIPQKPTLGLPMPLRSAEFVVLGLTNGPAFTPNPCLASQTRWVRERGLWAAAYAVHSYPDSDTLARYGSEGPFDGSTRLGALGNVGHQQALYNLRTMRSAGLQTPIVWLDVEPVPIFEWSPDTVANAAVVVGAARGYLDAGYRVGAYSTEALWASVVGDLRLGIPEWRAAGETSLTEALARCGPDRMFQGGKPVISQWLESNRTRDITCPGTSAEMGRWFHDYP